MSTDISNSVRRACSRVSGATEAVAELADQLRATEGSLVLFFAAPQYDREELSEAIASKFAHCQVVGCTTAGEIGPQGYAEGTLTGLALPAEDFEFEIRQLSGLQDVQPDEATHLGRNALDSLRRRGCAVDESNCFAFLLVDGLSQREEMVASSLHRALGGIHLFGGSAADNLDYGETLIYCDGEFVSDTAVLALVHTELPFEVFRTQHFVESDQNMVVTEADPRSRTVHEINAEPAALEYARVLGMKVEQLASPVIAANPVIVRVRGELYVRSIARVNEDQSLTFSCAIEAGKVLTIAREIDMVGSLQNSLDRVRRRVGEPSVTIGCDCILRSMESQQTGLQGRIAGVLEQHQTIGFTAYGVQFDAMHINQTFTGIMIGKRCAA